MRAGTGCGANPASSLLPPRPRPAAAAAAAAPRGAPPLAPRLPLALPSRGRRPPRLPAPSVLLLPPFPGPPPARLASPPLPGRRCRLAGSPPAAPLPPALRCRRRAPAAPLGRILMPSAGGGPG